MSSPERGGPRAYPAAAYPPGPGYEDPYYSQYASRSGSITPVIDEEARWVHCMLRQYSWYGAVTFTRHCFHLNNVLLSWFYIVTCTWNCLLMDVSIFHGWHQTTWHTEIHIRRDTKEYLSLHMWVPRMWIDHLFLFILMWEVCKSFLAVFWSSLENTSIYCSFHLPLYVRLFVPLHACYVLMSLWA